MVKHCAWTDDWEFEHRLAAWKRVRCWTLVQTVSHVGRWSCALLCKEACQKLCLFRLVWHSMSVVCHVWDRFHGGGDSCQYLCFPPPCAASIGQCCQFVLLPLHEGCFGFLKSNVALVAGSLVRLPCFSGTWTFCRRKESMFLSGELVQRGIHPDFVFRANCDYFHRNVSVQNFQENALPSRPCRINVKSALDCLEQRRGGERLSLIRLSVLLSLSVLKEKRIWKILYYRELLVSEKFLKHAGFHLFYPLQSFWAKKIFFTIENYWLVRNFCITLGFPCGLTGSAESPVCFFCLNLRLLRHFPSLHIHLKRTSMCGFSLNPPPPPPPRDTSSKLVSQLQKSMFCQSPGLQKKDMERVKGRRGGKKEWI